MVQRYRNQNNRAVAKQRKSRSVFRLSFLIISYAYLMLSCYPCYHSIVLYSVYSCHDAFACLYAESYWTYQTYVRPNFVLPLLFCPPTQVHKEEMLSLSSVFFPSLKIVDVLLWRLSSTAMAGSCFIGEYQCFFFASFIFGSF